MPYQKRQRHDKVEQVKDAQPSYSLLGKQFLSAERLENIAQQPEENAIQRYKSYHFKNVIKLIGVTYQKTGIGKGIGDDKPLPIFYGLQRISTK
jgi:hypothetical protein